MQNLNGLPLYRDWKENMSWLFKSTISYFKLILKTPWLQMLLKLHWPFNSSRDIRCRSSSLKPELLHTPSPLPSLLPIYLISTQTILPLCSAPTFHPLHPPPRRCRARATHAKTSHLLPKEPCRGVQDLVMFDTNNRNCRTFKFSKLFRNSIPIIQMLQVIKSWTNPEYNVRMILFFKCQQFRPEEEIPMKLDP